MELALAGARLERVLRQVAWRGGGGGCSISRGDGARPARGMLLHTAAASATAAPEVRFERLSEHVERVVLARPAKFNALTLGMVRELAPRYDAWVRSAQPRCVVMSGEGGKAFCAGGDVSAVRESELGGGRLGRDFFFEEYQLNHRIATAFKEGGLLQVSLWDGVTMGGGVGLSLHGRIRVCTEHTVFAMPETALGLFPDVGGTFALSRLRAGRAVGVYIALTGLRLGAADCLLSGLATHYVPRDRLAALHEGLVALGERAANEAAVYGLLQKMRNGAEPPALQGKLAASLAKDRAAIERCFQHDSLERIVAALESEGGAWAKGCLSTLAKCSPLSLKVTLAAILRHEGKAVTIGEALRNEYRATQRMLASDSDFVEGVRAILIDKDQAPKWRHKSLAEVTDAQVEAHFAPLPKDHLRGELDLQAGTGRA